MKVFVLKTCGFLALLLIAGVAHAEGGCPPGQIPHSGTDISSCGPIPNGYYRQQPQSAPQPPPEQWANRYGAIATDFAHGSAAMVNNLGDQSSAEQAAIEACQAHGGTACKIEIYYRNQCAVLVTGDKGHATRAGPTLNATIQTGIAFCQASGDSNCIAYYSGCSLPVRIQ